VSFCAFRPRRLWARGPTSRTSTSWWSYLDAMRHRRRGHRPTRFHVFRVQPPRALTGRAGPPSRAMIRHGRGGQLHKVCELLCEDVSSAPPIRCRASSSVRWETTKERFTPGEEHLAPGEPVFPRTDLDLGHAAAAAAALFTDGRAWGRRRPCRPTSSNISPPGMKRVGYPQVHQPDQGRGADLEQGRRPPIFRLSTVWSTPTSSCGTWAAS